MCLRFSLPYWVGLPEAEQKKILVSTAIEFAQKCKGKARAFLVVNPQEWTVEVHAEMEEMGI
jgi:hypothetical protein